MPSTSPAPELSPEYRDESIGYRLVNTAIAFIVLETVLTILRAAARRQQKTSFLYADVLVPLSLLFNIILCVLCIVAVQHAGVGRHTTVIMSTKPELVPVFFKIMYIMVPVIYCVAAALPKLAILDIYLHIFVERWSRLTSYATGVVLILNAVVNIPTTIWQCRPIAALWDPSIPDGHCNNIPMHFLYAGLPNIVTDVVMLLIPIPMILKLHVSRKTKLGVAVTFLTGSSGLITSILRFVGFTQSYADPFWAAVGLTVWTLVEPGMYLIAACLFTLKPLMVYIVYQSPLSSLLSKARLTSRSNNINESTRHTVGQRLPSADGQSDVDGLVPRGLGNHNTYVLHSHNDPPPIPRDAAGIRVEHQISTRSSSGSSE